MNRRRWWAATALWCGVIFALSSVPDHRKDSAPVAETLSRKVAHVVEYGVLALLVFRAVGAGRRPSGPSAVLEVSGEGGAGGHRPRSTTALSLLLCLSIAALDEGYQTLIPGRYGKIRDVALDVLGAALVLSLLSRRPAISFRESP